MRSEALVQTVALVLHFRDSARTARCLASLSAEGVRRVLLVDNSEDGGVSLHRLLDTYSGRSDIAIDVLEPGANLGFSAGVNRGMERIRDLHGECCVLLLNSDAVLRPGAHEALRIGILGGLEIASASMVSRDGVPLKYAYYQPYMAILSPRRLPGAFRYLSACCMLIGPKMSASPLFDERFFFYGEDIEIGWRLSSLGVAHEAVEGASVNHEGSASSRNGSLFYEYHMARAHLLLPGALARTRVGLAVMYLGRLGSLPLRSLVRSLRYRSIAPWHGLLLALRDVVARRGARLTLPTPR